MKPPTAVAATLTWPQVHAFRVRRHHLARRATSKELARVVGDIGGAQAQVMSAAELQIAVRTECTAADVRNALWTDRTLVKTWLMRGTLHLAGSADLPLYVAAMSGLWRSQLRPSWLKYIQTTEVEFWKIVDQIGAALDGEPMTREELVARVGHGKSARVLELLGSGWGGMLKPAARAGKLCFGPNRGQSVTFVRPDTWLGSWRQVAPDAAIAEVARRYLRAYGPATKTDFARWWGAWPGVGKAAWSGLAGELVTVGVGSQTLQALERDLPHLTGASFDERVQLLPLFDPYLMGHATRDHLFDRVHASRVSRTAGWISAVMLVDGGVVGTWTHEAVRRRVRVRVTPFGRLSAAERKGARARGEEIATALGAAGLEVVFA